MTSISALFPEVSEHQQAGSEPQQDSVEDFADSLRGSHSGSSNRSGVSSKAVVPAQERAFLVGVAQKGRQKQYAYSITESLAELGRLAETAGLEVWSWCAARAMSAGEQSLQQHDAVIRVYHVPLQYMTWPMLLPSLPQGLHVLV